VAAGWAVPGGVVGRSAGRVGGSEGWGRPGRVGTILVRAVGRRQPRRRELDGLLPGV